jgi:hypothetical protein
MTLEDAVLGGLLVAMDEGARSAEEIRVSVIKTLKECGQDVQRGLMVLEQIFSETNQDAEYVIGLGGDFVMSERGRELVDMAKKKLAVNELIGEKGINLDMDDLGRIEGASENVPG